MAANSTLRPAPPRGPRASPRTLVLACLVLAACATDTPPESGRERRPPVELQATVSRAEAGVSDPIVFRLTLDAAPDIEVSLPEIGDRIEGLRIVDMGREGPRSVDGRRWEQAWYKLEADRTGSYLLPATEVVYTTADGEEAAVQAPALFVEITSTLEPHTEDQDIRDLKPLERTERELPVPWILAALGGLVAAGLLTTLLLRRRRGRHGALPPTPEARARAELDDLDASGLVEEERYRAYVFHLSLILRRYLERKLGFPAAEQTTEELLGALRNAPRLDPELKQRTRGFLEETDPIKYRGLEPDVQATEAFRARLLEFLELAVASNAPEDAEHV